MESDKITADGVEVTGYPELARRYRVSSVPKTLVGETVEFVGAGPESMLLQHVQQAAGADGGPSEGASAGGAAAEDGEGASGDDKPAA